MPTGRRVERVVEAAFHLLDETEVVLDLLRPGQIDQILVDRVDEQLAEIGLEEDALAHHVDTLGVLHEDDGADRLQFLAHFARPVDFARRIDRQGAWMEGGAELAEDSLRLLRIGRLEGNDQLRDIAPGDLLRDGDAERVGRLALGRRRVRADADRSLGAVEEPLPSVRKVVEGEDAAGAFAAVHRLHELDEADGGRAAGDEEAAVVAVPGVLVEGLPPGLLGRDRLRGLGVEERDAVGVGVPGVHAQTGDALDGLVHVAVRRDGKRHAGRRRKLFEGVVRVVRRGRGEEKDAELRVRGDDRLDRLPDVLPVSDAAHLVAHEVARLADGVRPESDHLRARVGGAGVVVAELQPGVFEEVGEVVVREALHAAAGLVVGELHLAILETRHRRVDRLLEDGGLLADDFAGEVEFRGSEDDRVVAVLHHLHERDVRAGRGLAVLSAGDEAEETVLLDELEEPALAGPHLDDGVTSHRPHLPRGRRTSGGRDVPSSRLLRVCGRWRSRERPCSAPT